MEIGVLLGKIEPSWLDVAERARVACQKHKVGFRRGDLPPKEIEDSFFDGLDILLVVGGDGTILSAAHRAAQRQIPIMGVNLGRLGFLAEIEPEGIEAAIEQLVQGTYHLQKRLMLEAELNGKCWYALNDIVLEGMRRGRLMWFDLAIDGVLADQVACDGILVASPTGSTAYSLSCGGPILAPELDVMVVACICPHTLRSRPMVVASHTAIVLRASDGIDAALYVDGAEEVVLSPGQEITVRCAPFHLSMIRLEHSDFYKTVRKKLFEWSRP